MSAEKAVIDELVKVLLFLDRTAAEKLLDDAQKELTPLEIMEKVIASALERIGDYWFSGEVALSQVYMSTKICEGLVDRLFPEPRSVRDQPVCAVAVLEDHHSMGRKMVGAVLRSFGYAVKDYGSALSVEEIVENVKRDRIEVLFISTLMLPAALRVRVLKDRLKTASPNVKLVVGGAPFILDRKLWKEVGADAMGNTASDSMKILETLFAGEK